MKENRPVYICDCCGHEEFARHYNEIGDSAYSLLPTGWSELGQLHLCPDCAEVYKRVKAEVKAEKAKKGE